MTMLSLKYRSVRVPAPGQRALCPRTPHRAEDHRRRPGEGLLDRTALLLNREYQTRIARRKAMPLSIRRTDRSDRRRAMRAGRIGRRPAGAIRPVRPRPGSAPGCASLTVFAPCRSRLCRWCRLCRQSYGRVGGAGRGYLGELFLADRVVDPGHRGAIAGCTVRGSRPGAEVGRLALEGRGEWRILNDTA